MKILWITNPIFPDLSKALGSEVPVIGGWMYGLANDLVRKGISLTVATSRPNIKEYHSIVNGIDYYLLAGKTPNVEYDVSLEKEWRKIINDIKPDLVHIHGIEFAHGLALMKACPDLSYVISIQGLISIISRYYISGISTSEIRKNITFFDIIKRESIFNAQKKFEKRGRKVEKEYLRLATNVIGRTTWDHNHVKTINPNCKYHFCNESLRDEFYSAKKWNINLKNNHTIFLSQASYPIKGLHKVIEAIYLLKKVFPNIKLRIAGDDIIKTDSFSKRLKLRGYAKYIKALLQKYELEERISFLGHLNSEEMIDEYLNCHVFICPSSIENSPNSLGEAQLLGVPSIASYVGGVPDMVTQMKTGLLYRFEEVEMLAQHIATLFTNDNLAISISMGGIDTGTKRHDRNKNLKRTLEIYNQIISR